MASGLTSPGAPGFRLRGEVEGEERTFSLNPGDNLAGKASSCQVLLPLRGVSRRHALLRVDGGTVLVEDLASKNGTRINDLRISRGALRPGDRLGIGPAHLFLEAVDPRDTQLGLVLSAAGAPPGRLPERETTLLSDDEGLGREAASLWLDLIEAFVEPLSLAPEGDPTSALAALLAGLGPETRGAALVEWTAAETVVLAAAGVLGDVPRAGDPGVTWADRERRAAPASRMRGCSAAALRRRGAEPLGLVLWGDFAPSTVQPLLRVLVRLAGRLIPSPVKGFETPPPSAAPGGLVFPPGYVAGRAPAMAALYGELRAFAQGDLPVLVLGETGTGKEPIARILHASSGRRRGPLVAINCAAIPSDLLEAELFGIGKGVATGVAERPGKFAEAQGGTLYLDEIGDMPAALQVKLLRALQEGEIQPLGRAPLAVDVRIVASTNADLRARIEEGRFRADLYYRLAGAVVRLPPLRERRQDLPGLIGHFARAFSREAKKTVHGITVKALDALTAHSWPGNVRELEHEIRRLVYLCPAGQAIESTLLSEPILHPPHPATDGAADAPDDPFDLPGQLEAVERRLVRAALGKTGGNQSEAARLLRISRNGLAQRIRRLGLA